MPTRVSHRNRQRPASAFARSPKQPPKHRAVRGSKVEPSRGGGSRIRAAALVATAAVGLTGLAVTGGVVAAQGHFDSASAEVSAPTHRVTAAELAARSESFSRSADRTTSRPAAKSLGLTTAGGKSVSGTVNDTPTDPHALAAMLLPQYGMSSSEMGCLDELWNVESGWNTHAANPSSSAYGIPQALPGSKMAASGPDWENNAETQIRWGLTYIKSRYGTPCGAWSYHLSHGWY